MISDVLDDARFEMSEYVRCGYYGQPGEPMRDALDDFLRRLQLLRDELKILDTNYCPTVDA